MDTFFNIRICEIINSQEELEHSLYRFLWLDKQVLVSNEVISRNTRAFAIFKDDLVPLPDAWNSLPDVPVPVLRLVSLKVKLWLMHVVHSVCVARHRVDDIQRVSYDNEKLVAVELHVLGFSHRDGMVGLCEPDGVIKHLFRFAHEHLRHRRDSEVDRAAGGETCNLLDDTARVVRTRSDVACETKLVSFQRFPVEHSSIAVKEVIELG